MELYIFWFKKNFEGIIYIYMYAGTDASIRPCRLVPALNFENFFFGDSNIVIYSYG